MRPTARSLRPTGSFLWGGEPPPHTPPHLRPWVSTLCGWVHLDLISLQSKRLHPCEKSLSMLCRKSWVFSGYWLSATYDMKSLIELLSENCSQLPTAKGKCTHILGKTAEQVVVKWSNARPGRQIPAYTGVMLSQMPWGCPGGGADRSWIWLVHYWHIAATPGGNVSNYYHTYFVINKTLHIL